MPRFLHLTSTPTHPCLLGLFLCVYILHSQIFHLPKFFVDVDILHTQLLRSCEFLSSTISIVCPVHDNHCSVMNSVFVFPRLHVLMIFAFDFHSEIFVLRWVLINLNIGNRVRYVLVTRIAFSLISVSCTCPNYTNPF